jgi:hypothetical protein
MLSLPKPINKVWSQRVFREMKFLETANELIEIIGRDGCNAGAVYCIDFAPEGIILNSDGIPDATLRFF